MSYFRFSLEQLQKMECEAEYGNCPMPRSISPADLCELIHGYKIGAGYVEQPQKDELPSPAGIQLEQCPFCEATDSGAVLMDPSGDTHWVECASCRARGPKYKSEIGAIKAWDNRRWLTLGEDLPSPAGMHAKKGFYFHRGPEGSVCIQLEKHTNTVLTASEWASVVAYVSQPGENGDTHAQAHLFHMGQLYAGQLRVNLPDHLKLPHPGHEPTQLEKTLHPESTQDLEAKLAESKEVQTNLLKLITRMENEKAKLLQAIRNLAEEG